MSKFIPLDITSSRIQAANYWNELVEKCPAWMMLREFTQNGIEAPLATRSSKKQIIWQIFRVEGRQKLSVFNNGKGMTPADLTRLTDIGWSGLGKKQGRQGNKGMGARVAGLRNNKAGLLYLTCSRGRVYEMQLKFNAAEGAYGVCPSESGNVYEDVTQSYPENVRETEWVRVVFLGHTLTDDTASGHRQKGWVPADLLQRYFRLTGVEVAVAKDLTCWDTGADAVNYKLRTYSEWFGDADTYDVVDCDDGIKVHFAYFSQRDCDKAKDNYRWGLGAVKQTTSFGAVCFRDELYDFFDKSNWVQEAKHYGIPLVERQVCVVVELPVEAEVYLPDYRDELRHLGGLNADKAVRLRDYQQLVAKAIPGWLHELVEAEAEKHRRALSEEAFNEIERLFKSFKVMSVEYVETKDGQVHGRSSRQRIRYRPDGPGHRDIGDSHSTVIKPEEDGEVASSVVECIAPVPLANFAWSVEEREQFSLTDCPVLLAGGELYFDMTHPVASQCFDDVVVSIKKKSRGTKSDVTVREDAKSRVETAIHTYVAAQYGMARMNASVYRWKDGQEAKAMENVALANAFGLFGLSTIREALMGQVVTQSNALLKIVK